MLTSSRRRHPGQTASAVRRALAEPGEPFAADSEERSRIYGPQSPNTVVVHSSQAADRAAILLNANAFTVGHHILFRKDRFPPRTSADRTLLSHELGHVSAPEASALEQRRHGSTLESFPLAAQVTVSRQAMGDKIALLSDDQLQEEILLAYERLSTYISSRDEKAEEEDREYLNELEDEATKRIAGISPEEKQKLVDSVQASLNGAARAYMRALKEVEDELRAQAAEEAFWRGLIFDLFFFGASKLIGTAAKALAARLPASASAGAHRAALLVIDPSEAAKSISKVAEMATKPLMKREVAGASSRPGLDIMDLLFDDFNLMIVNVGKSLHGLSYQELKALELGYGPATAKQDYWIEEIRPIVENFEKVVSRVGEKLTLPAYGIPGAEVTYERYETVEVQDRLVLVKRDLGGRYNYIGTVLPQLEGLARKQQPRILTVERSSIRSLPDDWDKS